MDTVSTTHKTDHKGAIIGGVAGGVALIIFLLGLCFCMKKRSRAKQNAAPMSYDPKAPGAASQHACCGPTVEKGYAHTHGTGPEMKQLPLRHEVLKESERARSISPTGSDRSSKRSSRGSWRERRPPPLQIESLVTPVLHGPSNGAQDPFKDPKGPHLPTPDLGEDPFDDRQGPPKIRVIEAPRSGDHT